MTRRADGALALQLRQWGAFRGALIALAVVVLLATFAVTAWPRAVTALQTGQLHYRVGGQPAALRTVQTHQHQQGIPAGSAADQTDVSSTSDTFIWDAVGGILQKAHRAMPQPLRHVLTAPQWTQRTTPMDTTGPRANYHYLVQLEAFPELRSQSKLVSGRWPAPYRPQKDEALPPGFVGPVVTTSTPIEIALSADTAAKMGWKLGQSRQLDLADAVPLRPGTGPQQPVKLVGTIAPRGSGSDFWGMDALRNHPALEEICPGGICTGQFTLTSTAWLNPAPWSQMQYTFTSDLTGWYGVDTDALTASNLPTVQRQLAKFLASPPTGGIPLHFSTGLSETLDDVVAASGSTQTLLLLLAAGPLGVAIAVLVLGSELLVKRRRPVLALLSARGASALRIRGALAIEGALVAVPAAIVAAVAAVALFPPSAGESIGATTIALVACCAALPPAILAALGRSMSGERPRRRWRWVIEVVVVLVAVVALVVLFQRGLAPPPGGSADPLLVLTPLLIALAVCVLVLRAYPVPLRALAAALRRARGAVGAVGSARSRHGASAALIPVLAVLVGVATAVFSVVVFQTEQAGIVQASVGRVGADLSIANPALTAAQLRTARAVDGVRRVVPISSAGYAALTARGDVEAVLVLVADTDAVRDVQSALPDATRTPSGMAHTIDGRVPLVLGNWPDQSTPKDAILTTNSDHGVRVVSTTAPIGGVGNGVPWVLVDRNLIPGGVDAPHLAGALVAVQPGVDPVSVAGPVQRAAGHDAVVTSAAEQAHTIRAAPVVGGLQFALLAAAGLGALLAVMALVLTLVMSAAARVRLTATLRTLGFSRRQSTWLVVWEVAPIVLAGLLGGVVVGLLLPPTVLAPLNLTAFSGGVEPPLTFDPLTIAAVVASFLLVVAAIVAVTLAVATRRNPAGVLRTGEDE